MPVMYDLVSEGRKVIVGLEGLSWQLRRQLAHSSLQPEFERLRGVSTVEKHPNKRVSTVTVTAETPELVADVLTGIEAVLEKYKVVPHHHVAMTA